jgi:DNA-binding NarL/FixJ family response regulator
LTFEDGQPVLIALEVEEPALADRLAALLASVPGLRLASPREVADVALVTARAPEQASEDTTLTARELEVLALLAEGASNKEIARRLGISVHTAKFHVGQLLGHHPSHNGANCYRPVSHHGSDRRTERRGTRR